MTAPQVYIRDIGRHDGKTVTLHGWVYNKRSSGKLHFLQVRDGTGVIQAVMGNKDVPPEVFELGGVVTQESSVIITGSVRADKRSAGGYELGISDLKLVHKAEDYPIAKKDHGDAFLMDHRHLWLRSSRQFVILRVRHTIIKAVRDYFDLHGFTLIDAPIFTPAACEGTTNLFETKYFDDKAYLTQSGQLYMEAAAMAFGKVYCFGPTFRAEKSKTRRHLTEFWMVEPEVAYMDLEGDMELAEDFLCFIVQRVLEAHHSDLREKLERDTSALEKVQKPFVRMSYSAALEQVQALRAKETDPEKREQLALEWGSDFGAPHETVLTQQYDRPIMVHRYPAACKAFYMKRDPADDRVALCVDVLAPEGYGEIIGGGQREDSLEVLETAIKKHELPREAFTWYLDLRKYGSVPHAGFGLGIERTVAWICGLHHVRETIPFARMMERFWP